MSTQSKIEWTENTWNPIAAFLKRDIEVTVGGKKTIIPKGKRGWFCVKCSPGCLHCYAEGINLRLGNGLEYLHRNLDDIEFRFVGLDNPLKWRDPRMVFVGSMTDLFLEHIPEEMIMAVFAVMALAGHHTFQCLTKRSKRMRELVSSWTPDRLMDALSGVEPGVCLPSRKVQLEIAEHMRAQGRQIDEESWPLQNVWLGVSVEDQDRANERIIDLLKTPAALRYLSVEPLLGPVNLRGLHSSLDGMQIAFSGLDVGTTIKERIDWVIVGGESGRNPRPCNVKHVRDVVAQCQSAGVRVFVKQLGANVVTRNDDGFEGDEGEWPMDTKVRDIETGYQGAPVRVLLKHSKGGDWSEWPKDLQIRDFPKAA